VVRDRRRLVISGHLTVHLQFIDFPASSDYRSLSLKVNYKLIQVVGQEFVLPSDFLMNSRQSLGDNEVDAEYKDYRPADN
jgi:hypothetical protein